MQEIEDFLYKFCSLLDHLVDMFQFKIDHFITRFIITVCKIDLARWEESTHCNCAMKNTLYHLRKQLPVLGLKDYRWISLASSSDERLKE